MDRLIKAFRGYVWVAMLVLAGCATPGDLPPSDLNSSKTIAQSVESQKAETGKISSNLGGINIESTRIAKAGSDIKAEVAALPSDPHTQTIDKKADEIISSADQILDYSAKTNDAIAKIEELGKAIVSNTKNINKLEERVKQLQDEKTKLQNGAIKNLYDSLVWYFGIAFAMILGGVVLAFFYDKKFGITITIIGLITAAVAAALTFYLQQVALVSICVLLAGLLFGIYMGVMEIIKLYRSNKQTVNLVQTLKKDLRPEVKEKYFGEAGIANKIQTPTTKKMVAKILGKPTTKTIPPPVP
jgi:hypothetical protein